jgi:hypothetical protein
MKQYLVVGIVHCVLRAAFVSSLSTPRFIGWRSPGRQYFDRLRSPGLRETSGGTSMDNFVGEGPPKQQIGETKEGQARREIRAGDTADENGSSPSVQDSDRSMPKKAKKRLAVVGAGWGGWGAAKALCESGLEAEVIILDALMDPTGRTPYLSKSGKPVEAGTRGFWKE